MNSKEDQEKLSEALLHQHHTGRMYYVSESHSEASAATMQVYNQVVPIQSQKVQQPQLQQQYHKQQQLTPTQQGYKPYIGDWTCQFCTNVNFARHNECKRCARSKYE
jgi:hypothetical protein